MDELKRPKKFQHNFRIMEVLTLLVYQTIAATREYIVTSKIKIQIELEHFELDRQS